MGDPYARKLTNRTFFHAKTPIRGRVVVVLDGMLDNRGLNLIQPISRAFAHGSIIELIGTSEAQAAPGSTVETIAYIAFVELLDSGVLLVGDEIRWKDVSIGTIAGYDDTHMPNHQNTVVLMKDRMPGKALGLSAGDEILINGF
ncbi:MAG: DUF6917 domain-containing protein [Acidobacteriota bacterium]